MANENGDFAKAKLEDSNLANYGSKEHVAARKAAAESEKEFVGAGQKVGLEIWRVENKRTKADTPDFGVKRWPKEDYGSFYSGDSYLILNTYKDKESDKLMWDVHFWIGKESSQDEYGVAAYKAVELDDLLDDGPVQHRETQENESPLFQSYFPQILYMEGGIASGFRQVKPEEYKPRLFQVRRTRKTVRVTECPVKASSMNKGDVFILDAGKSIYTYVGETANAFEKMKAATQVQSMVAGRMGKSKAYTELDDAFWKVLGGTEKDVKPEVPEAEEKDSDKPIDPNNCQLWRLSDASGKIEFKKEAEGKLKQAQLDTNDVFIVDGEHEIFVWVGNKASPREKQQCMKTATEYLAKNGRPSTTPITRIKEGQVHHHFGSIVQPKAVGGLADIKKAQTSSSQQQRPMAPPVKKLW